MAPIMMSLSLIGFKILSGEGFYVQGHCDLALWLTDPQINREHLFAMAIKDTSYDDPKLNMFQVIEQTMILCSRSMWPCPLTY